MTWRTLAALAGALAIAGVAIALLGPNHGNTGLDPVAQAADTTAAAGTAAFDMNASFSFGGQTIPMSGSGAFDIPGHRMRMDLSMSVPPLGSMQMTELLDGTTIYMRVPSQIAQHMPGGKQWMKLDLESFGKSRGVDLNQLMQANQSNPADMLQSLKAVGNSHAVGKENIGGVPTTHYAATIDLSKAAGRIPDKQTVASLKQMFSQAGLNSVPMDVWIDRAGRVRRESMTMSSSQFSMQMKLDFTRFGVPVETTPPPSDQVLDAGAMLGALGQQSSG
jgi:hypothetical protein